MCIGYFTLCLNNNYIAQHHKNMPLPKVVVVTIVT
uniref:Uncharacterized protein n=1 Tax=Anguilla anguilla TaxID=7936 RepID=A0A0E9W0U9_ANGAN